jgi:hypothetical protein
MRSQSRAGFTLIELMVALALTMFLMIILTQCFVLSLETFSGMKGLGDMQQNLRTATTLLTSDLAEDHFEGKRRLSDPNIFNSAYPIQAGYVAIKQGSPWVSVTTATGTTPYVQEGFDNFGIPAYRAHNHVLAFTVKRKGNRPEAFFTTALHGTQPVLTQFFYPLTVNPLLPINTQGTAYDMRSQPNSSQVQPPAIPPKGYVPPPSYTDPTPDYATATYTTPYSNGGTIGFYSSQWAEVYYYLVFTGTTEQPNNPQATLGTPIYSLYRAQFVMVPDSTVVNSVRPLPPFPPSPPAPPGFPAALINPAVTNPLPFQGLSCCPFGANASVLFNSPIDAANRTVNKIVRRAIDINPATNPALAFPIAYPPAAGTDTRLIPNLGALSGANTGTGASEIAAGTQTEGSTELVLPNVISFQVQILDTWLNTQAFGDIPQLGATAGYLDSSLYSSANAALNANALNAGFVQPNPVTPIPFSLKAIRVTLRVWDNATRQTRQTSITQDL